MEVSMDDWKGLLTPQGVCRWWRNVVLGSPRAWTVMPLFNANNDSNSELFSLFIERSRNATFAHMVARWFYYPNEDPGAQN